MISSHRLKENFYKKNRKIINILKCTAPLELAGFLLNKFYYKDDAPIGAKKI
jgi:hypothetical protein